MIEKDGVKWNTSKERREDERVKLEEKEKRLNMAKKKKEEWEKPLFDENCTKMVIPIRKN